MSDVFAHIDNLRLSIPQGPKSFYRIKNETERKYANIIRNMGNRRTPKKYISRNAYITHIADSIYNSEDICSERKVVYLYNCLQFINLPKNYVKEGGILFKD